MSSAWAGGAPQRRASALDSAVEQRANQLFEKNAIDTIRQWESNTRKEIDDKKQELRKLVGARYRDLIDSADSINEMRAASEGSCRALAHVESAAGGASRRGRAEAAGGARGRARDALHVARRVRWLAQAPELVAAALDSRALLPAAARSAHALALLQSLGQMQPGLASRAPLLARHSAALQPLPARVTSLARQALAQPAAPSVAADAVAALALLEQWDAVRALSELLSARKAALRALLLGPAAGRSPLARMLAGVRLVQATLAHLHALWIDGLLAQALATAARDFEPPPELLHARAHAAGPLPPDSLARSAAQFLADAAEYIRAAVPRLLSDPELTISPAVLADAIVALAEACVSPGEWRTRCSVLLGSEPDLWSGLGLHAVCLARAAEVVSTALAGLPVFLRERLRQPATLAQPVAAAALLWRDDSLLDGRVEQLRLRALGISSRGASQAADLDAQLHTLLQSLAPLFAAPRVGADPTLRLLAQAAIRSAAAALVPELDAALAAVRQRTPADVPAALLVAHVARALASHSRTLPQALAQWPPPTPAASPAVRSAAIRAAALPEAWKALQGELRRVHLSAHCVWAAWAAADASGGLANALNSAAGAAGTRVARAWQAVVVADADEAVPLPAQPNPALASALFRACQELTRVGAHAVPRPALQLHLQLLHRHVLSALTAASASSRPPGTDGRDAAVQLLFDLELALELLAGARLPLAEADRTVLQAGVATAADGPRDSSRVAADEDAARTALLSLLDPIDAAFYGPHVRRLAAGLAQRTAALYGALAAVAGRSRDVKAPRPPAGAAPQVMALAPPAARFTLLPMPSSLAAPVPSATAAAVAPRTAPATATAAAKVPLAPAPRKSWWG